MYKLMLIEDDESLCLLVKEQLEKYGYKVWIQQDLRRINEGFVKIQPDLVVLDINLPYEDGFHVCRGIRRISRVPILITSARNTEMDQVMAIELGADDYIVKPFQPDLLLYKIKAMLRRVYGEYAVSEHKSLKIHDFVLDDSTLKISFRGRVVELSKNEYKIVRKLVENKDRVTPREELFEELWDDQTFVDDNTLTVNITRIKNKFQELGLTDVIRNRRGVGYVLDCEVFRNE